MGNPRSAFADDRAASEALGFVVLFGVILTSVAIMYAVGFGGLQDARDYERVNNAERAFDVLADNVEDVLRRGAPSRATEFKLADADLRMGDPVVVNGSVEHVSGTPSGESDFTIPTTEIRPIRYDANTGETIVYVGGAVVRGGADGAAMVREPGYLLTDERTILPIVETDSRDDTSVSGSTTVLVRTDRSDARLIGSRSVGRWNVTLTLNGTDRARIDAFRRYLAAQEATTDCTPVTAPSPGYHRVTCHAETERVTVTVFELDVDFE